MCHYQAWVLSTTFISLWSFKPYLRHFLCSKTRNFTGTFSRTLRVHARFDLWDLLRKKRIFIVQTIIKHFLDLLLRFIYYFSHLVHFYYPTILRINHHLCILFAYLKTMDLGREGLTQLRHFFSVDTNSFFYTLAWFNGKVHEVAGSR